uniref:Uncharacterized protein n=1 Tax=Oryza sativa subsp. japonica TaxID=39947 RepID=Q69MC5_ORYSJ|nr:hypothetical protein [Oryza sativa Japonica Group]
MPMSCMGGVRAGAWVAQGKAQQEDTHAASGSASSAALPDHPSCARLSLLPGFFLRSLPVVLDFR